MAKARTEARSLYANEILKIQETCAKDHSEFPYRSFHYVHQDLAQKL